jgi:hypothetical protein
VTLPQIKKRIKGECDFIRSLANAYTCYGFRGDPKQIKMALLTAYFDESGNHDGNHVCVVAGYVGIDAQWTSFVGEWIPALGKQQKNLHVSSIRNFKRAAPLFEKLGAIPERHHLQRVIGGVRWNDYKSIVKGKLRKKFTHPYMLAAQACIFQVVGTMSRSDEIMFYFSRQDVQEKNMRAMYKIVFEQHKTDPRVKGIDYIFPDITVCCDPADYLAFSVREYKLDPHSVKARVTSPILGDGKAIGYIYTPERLRENVEFLVSSGASMATEAIIDRRRIPTRHFPRSAFFNIFEDD